MEVSVEEVTGTIEGKVEAQSHKNVLLNSLYIIPGHRALLLSSQVIVAIYHILIIWKLRLFQLCCQEQAGASQ